LRIIGRNIENLIFHLFGSLYYKIPKFPDGARILDLGRGTKKVPNSIGIDIVNLSSVDIVCDIEKGLPFVHNSFDFIYTSHVMEHTSNLPEVMKETHRILKKGGLLIALVPYYKSYAAFQDPTHKSFFTLNTFEYFCNKQNVAPKWYFDFSFDRIRRKSLLFRFNFSPFKILLGIIFNSSPRLQKFYERSFFSIFPADKLQIEIEK
jgi:SAM-dependent methyltransferase